MAAAKKIRFYMPYKCSKIIGMLEGHGFEFTEEFLVSDFTVFKGGADVPAHFAGYPNHKQNISRTSLDWTRTVRERKLFFSNVTRGKLNVGICRGAQAMWAFSGGRLYKDVDHHQTTHVAFEVPPTRSMAAYSSTLVDTSKVRQFPVTSTHHQMCQTWSGPPIPFEYAPLLVANMTTERENWHGIKERSCNPKVPQRHHRVMDLEAYYIPKTQAFGVQFHPEYYTLQNEHTDWFLENLDAVLYEMGV